MVQRLISKLTIKSLPGLPTERGQTLIIFVFAILGLIAMLGIALDLGLVYIERNRINRTTDAATLGSVVELPYEQDAINRAIEFIQLNGYNVGQDTEILVRGCVDPNRPYGPGGSTTAPSPRNWSETGMGTEIITTTTTITGITYITSTVQPPVATFMIDTGSFQTANGDGDDSEECNPGADLYGTADKIEVKGQVNVRMNFMQFFGFGFVPVQETAVAQNVTNLDVMVVFDVSGSMESETNCYDCWVRATYNPDYPNNGYFNPLPQAYSSTTLCGTSPPQPYIAGTNNYLVHEAELYSREVGDWDFDARVAGQGFWVLQRASRKNSNAIAEVTSGTNNEGNWQGNQAGTPGTAAGSSTGQSSNVCGPTADSGICASAACNSNRDCSAYIMSHPYNVYGQQANASPRLQGAAYDASCFSGSTLSGACWSGKSGNPDYPAPSNVPYVEYDFTPTWSGPTYIWIRAIGGGEHAREWNGINPTTLQNYRDTVFWQVNNSAIIANSSVPNNAAGISEAWRNNRADNSLWGWVKLTTSGGVATTANTEYTFRLYQGSAGYSVDKIVFTDDSSGSTGSPPAAMLLNLGKGPAASPGSATREACNACNPAFGGGGPGSNLQNLCTCRTGADVAAGVTGYGSGAGCTVALDDTSMLNDDLYSGIQPLRGAQEAVKRFVKRLDPKFDQVGFVAFTTNTVNSSNSRSKLECLRSTGQSCYDPTLGTPISYTKVLNAVERQWAVGGTDIAEGMREALEELGVSGYAVDNSCSTSVNDGKACSRSGSARRVIILLTDGSPNNNPGGGCAVDSLWDGLVGPNDDNYECAMYYAWEAANNNVTVYAIGLGAGVNLDLLNAMATGVDPRGGVLNDGNDVTYFNGRGGQAFNAATPGELDAIFDTILSNIYVRIVG